MGDTETLELDEVLEQIVFYSFDEAKAKLSAGEECVPFTVVVDGEKMYEETHPGDDVVSCRANAEATVKSSSTFSTHYVFCYDGFLMTDDGQMDAVIVECAQRDMEKAYVIGLLYTSTGDGIHFEAQPAYLDSVDTFFDRAAVDAAKALEADGAEMADAQELLLEHLAGEQG